MGFRLTHGPEKHLSGMGVGRMGWVWWLLVQIRSLILGGKVTLYHYSD